MQLWLCCTLLVFGADVCFAQRPRPCRSPPLHEGSFSVTTQNGSYVVFGKYVYDAILQRIRVREFVQHSNRTFTMDVLLLYREHVMYFIDRKKEMCKKRNLTSQFHPVKIPCNSTLLGQVVIGSLSAPGEGLVVNSWAGQISEDQGDAGKYIMTFTEFGCLPVTVLYNRPQTGWIVTNFYNIIRGIENPSVLIPPLFCKNASLETEDGDFFTAFI